MEYIKIAILVILAVNIIGGLWLCLFICKHIKKNTLYNCHICMKAKSYKKMHSPSICKKCSTSSTYNIDKE